MSSPLPTPRMTLTSVAERLRSLRVGLAALAAHESAAEILTVSARTASEACGLQRVCLWRLDGEELVPINLFDGEHPHLARDFLHLAGLVRPRLAAAPIEASVARTHQPLLVADALHDDRVFRPLAGITGTAGYVVAAVPDGSGTLGLLTADHGGGAAVAVDELDLELLSSFGEGLGRLLVARRDADPAGGRDSPTHIQRLREGLSALASATEPEEVGAIAVRALCEAVGFDRAALLTTEDGMVRTLAVHAAGSPDWARAFAADVRAAAVSLDRSLPEFAVLEDPQPVLVGGPLPASHPFAAVAARARIGPYVAAPVLRHGRVVAMLHADRLPANGALGENDRELLGAFADAFGHALGRSVHHRQARASPSGRFVPALDLLTAREREVLGLVAAGATNADVASTLVISETTAKSHVQHILRKLGAANRADAVARYLQAGGVPSAPERQTVGRSLRRRGAGDDRQPVETGPADHDAQPA